MKKDDDVEKKDVESGSVILKKKKDNDPDKILKQLIDIKRVGSANLPECFKCAAQLTEGTCTHMKNQFKTQKDITIESVLDSFAATADSIDVNNNVPPNQRVFWLCGNHANRNTKIDPDRYGNFFYYYIFF